MLLSEAGAQTRVFGCASVHTYASVGLCQPRPSAVSGEQQAGQMLLNAAKHVC